GLLPILAPCLIGPPFRASAANFSSGLFDIAERRTRLPAAETRNVRERSACFGPVLYVRLMGGPDQALRAGISRTIARPIRIRPGFVRGSFCARCPDGGRTGSERCHPSSADAPCDPRRRE